MKKFLAILLIFSLKLNAQTEIFQDFENANVEIIKISGNQIIFRPALKTDSNTTRCWFYFGVKNFDTTKPLVFKEVAKNKITVPTEPAIFLKNKWLRIKKQSENGDTTVFKFKADTNCIYFATGYPYTYSMMLNFTDSTALTIADTGTLTYSEHGLRLPLIKIGNGKRIIWIQARQHAFEATANYALEGFIDYFIANYKKYPHLKKYTLFALPMADADNVLAGASGRMQKPVDFNRDWSPRPHWKAVKKVIDTLKSLSTQKKLWIFIDFHSTYPSTNKPLTGYFNCYQIDDKKYWNLEKFNKIFTSQAGYSLHKISSTEPLPTADNFFINNPDNKLNARKFSSTFEIDWNLNNNHKLLTISELRKLGENLAKALILYLK